MGKTTGFMEYDRDVNLTVPPLERIKHYLEFHRQLSLHARRHQAARCMNCGVPFCQSGMMLNGMATGCPLHNLIPEWNDAIYREHDQEGLQRLLATNNFPEFTGRVCPALCEAACTCGLNGSSVTVHDNELFLIERGFEEGWVTPAAPPVQSGKNVAIVGSGPAGLAAADQLCRMGHHVVVFERDACPGGLLMYGIPNMKLDKSIITRRIRLMEQGGVEFRLGTDVGRTFPAEDLCNHFDAVILCCGSKLPRDLHVPGRNAQGIHFAVDYLTCATQAVVQHQPESHISAKGKHVVIVGGGDTGNDCVGTAIRQGCRSVVQLEMMEKLPLTRSVGNPWPQWPRVCKTDYGQEEAVARFGKDPRKYQTTVRQIISNEEGNVCQIQTVRLQAKPNPAGGRMIMEEIPQSEEMIPCDLLLIAAGFTGCENYIADAFGAALTGRGTLQTIGESYQTNIKGVFAAGDARRGQSLVVWAIAEGRACSAKVDRYLMQK